LEIALVDQLAYGKRNQAGDTDFANPHFIATGKGT
jgi:3'(2'), 5'-bisphosphate nucleotidase